jgi:hypothetical protein
MSASAYNAQGAKLELGVTSASKTISAISKANPAVITATAHGLTDGAVVKITAVVGMVEINNKVGVAVVVDANNFKLFGVDSTLYTTYGSAGSATPTKVKVGNWKGWNGFGGSGSDIDVTDLDSGAKEFRMGLQDNGELQIDVQTSDTDEGQQALNGSKAASGPASPFVLTFANLKTRSFNAYCKQFSETGAVDGIIMSQATMKVTGVVSKG